MNVTRLLWGLWGAIIISMLLRQTIDTYMVVALINAVYMLNEKELLNQKTIDWGVIG